MYFEYGEKEISYLKSKDKKLAEVIEQIGHIDREVDTDIFSAVVHHIIGQQISTKAQATIWQRMQDKIGKVDASGILDAGVDELQSLGMTYRKVVASLYLWAVSGGAIPEMKDYAPKTVKTKGKKLSAK